MEGFRFYTSYYANYRKIPKNFFCVGISRVCPDGFKDGGNFMFVEGNVLAPSRDLLDDIKHGRIGEDEYKRRYVEGLLANFGENSSYGEFADFFKRLEDRYSQEYDGIVFLCYESPENFCHRHILRHLMTRIYGIPCEEFGHPDIDTPSKVQESLF